MPFSFSTYGTLGILVMVGILTINQVVQYFRNRKHRQL